VLTENFLLINATHHQPLVGKKDNPTCDRMSLVELMLTCLGLSRCSK